MARPVGPRLPPIFGLLSIYKIKIYLNIVSFLLTHNYFFICRKEMAFTTTTLQFGSFAPITIKVPAITTGTACVEEMIKLQFGNFPPRFYMVPTVMVGSKVSTTPFCEESSNTKPDMGAYPNMKNAPIQIASKDGFKTICVYHPNPFQHTSNIYGVQILDAHHVSIWEGKHKNEVHKHQTLHQPMTRSMKRNARRSRQRKLKKSESVQPQTIIQVCPLITISNPFEMLQPKNRIPVKDRLENTNNTNKPIQERLEKRHVHECLGSYSQPKKASISRHLGPKKPSVF